MANEELQLPDWVKKWPVKVIFLLPTHTNPSPRPVAFCFRHLNPNKPAELRVELGAQGTKSEEIPVGADGRVTLSGGSPMRIVTVLHRGGGGYALEGIDIGIGKKAEQRRTEVLGRIAAIKTELTSEAQRERTQVNNPGTGNVTPEPAGLKPLIDEHQSLNEELASLPAPFRLKPSTGTGGHIRDYETLSFGQDCYRQEVTAKVWTGRRRNGFAASGGGICTLANTQGNIGSDAEPLGCDHMTLHFTQDMQVERIPLWRPLLDTLEAIDREVSTQLSFEGYWQRGGHGVYKMKSDGSLVQDSLYQYFLVLSHPWEEKLRKLETILEAFAKPDAAHQECVYMEMQYLVELRLVGLATKEKDNGK